jgi:hypothetical protein
MRPSVQQPILKDKNDKKILLKKPLFDLEVKGQGPTKVITVLNTPLYDHIFGMWVHDHKAVCHVL